MSMYCKAEREVARTGSGGGLRVGQIGAVADGPYVRVVLVVQREVVQVDEAVGVHELRADGGLQRRRHLLRGRRVQQRIGQRAALFGLCVLKHCHPTCVVHLRDITLVQDSTVHALSVRK